MSELDRAREALRHLDAGCPRQEWAVIGMAAKDAGLDVDDFISWSRGAANFDSERDCRDAWRSFKSGSVTAATLFARAREAGWREPTNGRHHEAPKRPQEPRKAEPKGKTAPFDFRAVWAGSEAATVAHAYIERKLGLPDGLRVYRGPLTVAEQVLDGALLVPVHDADGELQSWQAIPAEGDKRSAPGAPIKGGSLIVGGKPVEGEPLFIVEGIGQAWSCHQATGKPAVVCFGAGNIEAIARQMTARFPSCHIVVVADRGKEQDAERIAAEVGGAWAGLPNDWPANSDINDMHVRDGLQAVADLLAKPSELEADPDEPRELDLKALAAKTPKPPAFIVPDWLPAGEVTLLAAHGGTGKSTTALHLAVCLATGRDFHGLPVERRAVDFVSFEDAEPVIHWRLHRICDALGVRFEDLLGGLRILDGTQSTGAWFARGEYGAAGATPAYQSIAKRVGGPGRVVIVDGSSDVYAANENDRAQVKAFLRTLRRLIADDGALVLVAHVDKLAAAAAGQAQGYSGSSGWHNGVRCRWFMHQETDDEGASTGAIVIEVRKSNLGRSGARMVLRFDAEAHVFRREDEAPRGPFQRVDESDAICAAIRAAWEVGDPVPAAQSGQRTAHAVCEAREDFPASLKGRAGRRRFYKTLEQLRAAGKVCVENWRRPNRHLVEVLNVRD